MIWLILNAVGSGLIALAGPVNAWKHWEDGETRRPVAWAVISLGSATACVGYVMRIVSAG